MGVNRAQEEAPGGAEKRKPIAIRKNPKHNPVRPAGRVPVVGRVRPRGLAVPFLRGR